MIEIGQSINGITIAEIIHQPHKRRNCSNCNRRLFRFKDKEGNLHEVCSSIVSEYPFNVCPHQDWEIYFQPKPHRRGQKKTGGFERRLRHDLDKGKTPRMKSCGEY